MKNSLDQKYSIKVASFVFLAFIILSGLILFLGGYYSWNLGQVAGETEVIDPQQLPADYKQKFRQIFNNYLLLEDSDNFLTDDYLAKTGLMKQNLLVLKVPAEFKDIHLQAVIALSEIETGVKTKNLDLILSNIYKLREIINNF